MINKKDIQNIIRSKYFIILTITALALVFQIFHFGGLTEPKGSLQLSSEMTGSKPTLDMGGIVAQQQYYDLQLEILADQHTYIQTSSGKQQSVVLPKGSMVSISVPSSAIGNGIIDPTLNAGSVDLEKTITQYNMQNSPALIPQYPIPNNEVDIDKTKDRSLVGESAMLQLQILAKNKQIRIKKIEEVEHDDEDDGSDDSEATTNCLSCTPFFYGKKTISGIVDWSKGLFIPGTPIKNIEEAIQSYERSSVVKSLMNVAHRGYRARNKQTGRTSRPQAPIVSHSIKACYNGVKAALEASGMTEDLLQGRRAKDAGPQLLSNGFMNLLSTPYKNKIKSPYDAPLGSVLVYGTTDGSRNGHIEIKTENGFISDYYSPTARTGPPSAGWRGKRRVLIGVYIKKTPEINNYLALQSIGSRHEKVN